MACDRFVHFKEKSPPWEDLQKVIEDYLGEALTSIEWRKDRFLVELRGSATDPFKRVGGRNHSEGPRYLEVSVAPKEVDVITRLADEYTNTIAFGLARLFARFWQGSFDATEELR